MKTFTALAALSLAASEVSGHYIFQTFGVGSTKNPAFKYIRPNSNYNSPVTDLSSNDLRCNEGGATGASTDVLELKAGDSFTFGTDTPVYHQGPVSIYMSKAPGSVKSYDGSGGWFKIKDWGPTGGQWNLGSSYSFNVPSCLPAGEYLIRIQSLGIHNPWPAGTPQFYISCAQVKVTGGGSANPPTVSIPGVFKASDSGYTANIYNGNLNNYVVPGPSVWQCGAGDNTPAPNPGTPATPTTLVTTSRPEPTPEPSPEPPTCGTAKWGQCGGIGFTGCSSCASGSTCNMINEYYSQCV